MRRALDGLSPWDAEPGLLDAALNAALADSSRPRAWSTTLDAYPGAGGAPAFVALAVPETDVLALRRAARPAGWTALHRGPLAWAGDPVAVAAGAAGDGSLRFFGALDPASGTSAVPQPFARADGRIRFLAHGAELAVVGPDEPAPAAGPSGLRLGGLPRRLLLAWTLQAPPLLDRRTSVSDRLIIWRDVPDRLQRLFPFATFGAPRAVLAGGRLLWMADGFLASARFPLADHVSWNGDDVNFLCAAYVATVDAVSGATRLFLRPPDLKFAARLAAGMGAVALPSDSLGPDLRRHLGYPEELFLAQAEMLARHRGDTGTAARPWAVAMTGGAAAAGRRASRAARHARPARRSAPNRRSCGGCSPWPTRRGTRWSASSRARPDPTASCRCGCCGIPRAPIRRSPPPTAAWRGSPAAVGAVAEAAGPAGNVHRGDLAAIPVAGTLAYAQFLYATANRQDVPLMPRGIAVLAAGHLGVGADPESAVRALGAAHESAATESVTSASLAQARAAFLALDSAVHRGDWVQFGRAYETLRRALGTGGGAPRRP